MISKSIITKTTHKYDSKGKTKFSLCQIDLKDQPDKKFFF